MLIFTAMRRRTTQSMLAEGLVHPANRTPKPKTEKKPIPSRTGAKPETQSSAPLEAPARAPGSSFPVSQFHISQLPVPQPGAQVVGQTFAISMTTW